MALHFYCRVERKGTFGKSSKRIYEEVIITVYSYKKLLAAWDVSLLIQNLK